MKAEKNLDVKTCAHCNDELENQRKKFCSDHCKYRFNSIKKDKESHLPPFKKRTEGFFSMITGYEWASKGSGQGKRSGGGVKGAMSARVDVTVERWVPLNQENINTHFTSISFYTPGYIMLGNGDRVNAEEIEKRFGLKIPTKPSTSRLG